VEILGIVGGVGLGGSKFVEVVVIETPDSAAVE
jgi:hypothetical protein